MENVFRTDRLIRPFVPQNIVYKMKHCIAYLTALVAGVCCLVMRIPIRTNSPVGALCFVMVRVNLMIFVHHFSPISPVLVEMSFVSLDLLPMTWHQLRIFKLRRSRSKKSEQLPHLLMKQLDPAPKNSHFAFFWWESFPSL